MSCYALAMEVLIPSQESERSCICVLEVSIVTLSIGLNCLDSVVFFKIKLRTTRLKIKLKMKLFEASTTEEALPILNPEEIYN
jgi:hypothetical protein